MIDHTAPSTLYNVPKHYDKPPLLIIALSNDDARRMVADDMMRLIVRDSDVRKPMGYDEVIETVLKKVLPGILREPIPRRCVPPVTLAGLRRSLQQEGVRWNHSQNTFIATDPKIRGDAVYDEQRKKWSRGTNAITEADVRTLGRIYARGGKEAMIFWHYMHLASFYLWLISIDARKDKDARVITNMASYDVFAPDMEPRHPEIFGIIKKVYPRHAKEIAERLKQMETEQILVDQEMETRLTVDLPPLLDRVIYELKSI